MDFSMWDVDLAQRRRENKYILTTLIAKLAKISSTQGRMLKTQGLFPKLQDAPTKKRGNLHSQTGCRLKDWQRRRKPGTFHKNFH
jgi:hypothetical protein